MKMNPYGVCPRKPSGTFYVRFEYKGKDKRISTKTTDEARAWREARRIYEDFITRRIPAEEKRTPPPALREFVPVYLEEYAKTKKSYRTICDHTKALLRAQFLADMCLDEIGPKAARRFIRWRQAQTTRLGRPPSNATINREVTRLRHMLKHASQGPPNERIIPESYFPSMSKLPPLPEEEREIFLTDEQEARLLAAAAPHLQPIIRLLLQTGMRIGEALSLEWKDTREGEICLKGENTKSGKPRLILLTAEAREILDELKRERAEPRVASCYVFHKPDGKPYKRITKAFRNAVRRAGLPTSGPEKITPHVLRHTAASRLSDEGAPEYGIAEFLGHSPKSGSRITRRYMHPSKDSLSSWTECLSHRARRRREKGDRRVG